MILNLGPVDFMKHLPHLTGSFCTKNKGLIDHYYSAWKGAEFRIRDRFFSGFFLCRDFFGNLRRAVKLVLNLPVCLSAVVSVGLLRILYESKF